ncbi:MAG: hypothetical protein ACUVRV_04985 [Cyanobacteriota bacterium]
MAFSQVKVKEQLQRSRKDPQFSGTRQSYLPYPEEAVGGVREVPEKEWAPGSLSEQVKILLE